MSIIFILLYTFILYIIYNYIKYKNNGKTHKNKN